MSEIHLTRRAAVGGVGAAATAVGVAGVARPAAGLAAVTDAVTVGVLTPAGTSHPRSTRSLLDGLAAGFAGTTLDATVVDLPVTYGYLGAAATAEELVAAGAQVVVASVSTAAARSVGGVCRDAGVGLVVANVGAHLVGEPIEGAVHNSLQHWQCSLRGGEWARNRLGRSLFAIVAAPDAGYDTVFAFRRGFLSAGGRYAGLALTHDMGSGDGVSAAVHAARRSGADVVSVHASGSRAAAILRACRTLALRAEVVVDALALEPGAADLPGRAVDGVHSIASWTPGTAAGRDFERRFRARTGRRPDAFAALGHDTAALVTAGAERLGSSPDWSRLADALAGRRVAGARGLQVVDRRLRTVSTPLAVRRANRSGRSTAVAKVAAVRGVPASMTVLDPDRVAAYVNEYLGT